MRCQILDLPPRLKGNTPRFSNLSHSLTLPFAMSTVHCRTTPTSNTISIPTILPCGLTTAHLDTSKMHSNGLRTAHRKPPKKQVFDVPQRMQSSFSYTKQNGNHSELPSLNSHTAASLTALKFQASTYRKTEVQPPQCSTCVMFFFESSHLSFGTYWTRFEKRTSNMLQEVMAQWKRCHFIPLLITLHTTAVNVPGKQPICLQVIIVHKVDSPRNAWFKAKRNAA